jgi:hypothetical protein
MAARMENWARWIGTIFALAISLACLLLVARAQPAPAEEKPTILVTLPMTGRRLLENADQFAAVAMRVDELAAPISVVGIEPRAMIQHGRGLPPGMSWDRIAQPLLWIGPPDSDDAVIHVNDNNGISKASFTFLASATSTNLRERSSIRRVFFGVGSNRQIAEELLQRVLSERPLEVIICHNPSSEEYAEQLADFIDRRLNDAPMYSTRWTSNEIGISCRHFARPSDGKGDTSSACGEALIGTVSWFDALPTAHAECDEVYLSDALTSRPVIDRIRRAHSSVKVYGTIVASPAKKSTAAGEATSSSSYRDEWVWGSVVYDFVKMSLNEDGKAWAPDGWQPRYFKVQLIHE